MSLLFPTVGNAYEGTRISCLISHLEVCMMRIMRMQCRWRWYWGRLERKRWCRRQKKTGRTIVTAFGWLGVTTNDAVWRYLSWEVKNCFNSFSQQVFYIPTFSFPVAVCDLWLATLFFKRFSNLAMYSWNSKTGTSRGLREDISPTTFETNRLQVCHPWK